jgi:hypothetical protein
MEIENNNDKNNKKVNISGTSNKYQINKLKKEPIKIKKRKEIERWGISSEYFAEDKQLDILIDIGLYKENILNNFKLNLELKDYKTIIGLINDKITGYKSQDFIKKRLDNDKLINIDDVLDILKESNMKCYYCKKNVLLLYDIVREKNQWTLDRLNNELGHNKGNCVMSCLSCNLKRRRTCADAFLFTKQLCIVKKDGHDVDLDNVCLNNENTK